VHCFGVSCRENPLLTGNGIFDRLTLCSESTQSLTESVTNYPVINGRRYHRYKEGCTTHITPRMQASVTDTFVLQRMSFQTTSPKMTGSIFNISFYLSYMAEEYSSLRYGTRDEY
jgi:hypothetical protein